MSINNGELSAQEERVILLMRQTKLNPEPLFEMYDLACCPSILFQKMAFWMCYNYAILLEINKELTDENQSVDLNDVWLLHQLGEKLEKFKID